MNNILGAKSFLLKKGLLIRVASLMIVVLTIFFAVQETNIPHHGNWEDSLKIENESYLEIIEDPKTTPNIKETVTERYQKNLTLLEENISPKSFSFISFVKKQQEILILILFIIFLHIVQQPNNKFEISYNAKMNRKNIFNFNILFNILLIFYYILILLIVSGIISVLFWGKDLVTAINLFNSLNSEKSFGVYLVQYFFLKSIEFVSVVVIISSIKKLPISRFLQMSIILIFLFSGAVLLSLDMNLLYTFSYANNLDLTIFTESKEKLINGLSLSTSIIKTLIYTLFFYRVSLYTFIKQDIK